MSQPKRSITDHFSVIPKQPLKELKIHPMFIKKPKTRKNESPASLPKAIAVKTQETVTVETNKVKPKSTQTEPKQTEPKQTRVKPVISNQPVAVTKIYKKRPQKQLLKLDTHTYFQTQKQKRETKKFLPKLPYTPSQDLDIETIEHRMNHDYPHWKKDVCCKTFFNTMMFQTDSRLLWCDKYRPNRVEGLLGFVPDFEYLRDWLHVLKIQKDPAKKAKGVFDGEEHVYNVILMVGGHGVGKTAAAYTAAKETGYAVFEINSTIRRAGKDVAKLVGEMTASHLVQFDHQSKKRKKGETIIIRDTVKKSKKIDISTHFKRMLTMNTLKEQKSEQIVENDKDVAMETPEDVVMEKSENIVTENSEDIVMETAKDVDMETTEEVTSDIVMKNENLVIMEETETSNNVKPAPSCDNMIRNEHKQSLVLLEEVDILFEEDKGFWPAVIELCQKSKRPIIMTCNDSSQIPFDHLNIQSTIYLDTPEKNILLPYLQLICYSERRIVEPYDLEFLCELYHYDTRKMIDTLQLWLDNDNRYLFAKVMGFSDLLNDESDGLSLLMDRLKGTSPKTIELCVNYFTSEQLKRKEKDEQEEVMGIESIYKMMESAAHADAWIGLTQKQKHQIYDIDQYDNKIDMMNNNSFFIYKNPSNLDRWDLGEIIENSISVINLQWTSNNLSAWSSHWEDLCYQSKDRLNECMEIVSPLLNYPSTEQYWKLIMSEYMPNIRSMCLYDQGIAGKGRTPRSRKRIRYIKLDADSRDVINWQQI